MSSEYKITTIYKIFKILSKHGINNVFCGFLYIHNMNYNKKGRYIKNKSNVDGLNYENFINTSSFFYFYFFLLTPLNNQ